MKKTTLILGMLLIINILPAQESILVDCIHGSAYYVDPELANPLMIDFNSVFPAYDITVITKDSIDFHEILITDYLTGAQELEYTVDLPGYYPENPQALYVIVHTGNIEELRSVTGVITNPAGEIVSGLYNCQGHYDGASGDGWTININLLEQINYEVIIGYGPILYSSTALSGKYDLEEFDAVVRIKDDSYYPIWGVTQEFSEYDLTAFSEEFDEDLAFLNVYNFHDPMLEKPFIHFRTEKSLEIDLEIYFQGFLKLADPMPVNTRGKMIWNDFTLEPNSSNEIIYEGVLNDKLDLIHFGFDNDISYAENLSGYPLNNIRLLKYKGNGKYTYTDIEKLTGNNVQKIPQFDQYNTKDLLDKMKSDFYAEAIACGLVDTEAQHLVYDYLWIETLLKKARDIPEHYFGFYHFEGELYDRIIPCSLHPYAENIQRNMWVMLYDIQEGIDVEPITLLPAGKDMNSLDPGYEMLEYGVTQEHYSRRGASREDEFFGVELGEYILYWESGNVGYYNNTIADEISENADALDLIEGYYTFNVEDIQEMGILYDLDFPQLPIAAALKVNDNGRLIALGTSYFFCDLNDHYQFLNNSLFALLHSSYFTGSQNNEIPPPLKTELNSYPNPFNPFTTITFCLPGNYEEINLSVYNIRGQKVKTFENIQSGSSEYSVIWNGCDDRLQSVTSGIYFFELNYNEQRSIKKILLLK